MEQTAQLEVKPKKFKLDFKNSKDQSLKFGLKKVRVTFT